MKQKKAKIKQFLLFTFCMCATLGLYAQNITVTGNVKDERGEPVIGANIKVVGEASKGTISDFDGNFSLQVLSSDKKLTVSYIGMKSSEVDITPGRSISVVLSEDSEQLDDVVVIGYQTVRRRDLTGSVSSVSGNSIASTPVANAAQALQGKLPGVNVTSQDGRPDAEISIRIRGGSSISQSNDPLVLIDGIPSSLGDVPADQIESIDVLKDASSTAIYGARGANGVILVTTKKAKEGKVSVSYNGYAKFNRPTGYIDALNPYEYVSYVWANADANGTGYRTVFEKLYGIGDYADLNPGGIENYRNVKATDIQREVYNSSFSHNHDFTVSGGTDRTKALFALNYSDEEGMKLNSYAKRANISLKVNHKLADNLNIGVDARYTDSQNMGEGGDILSTAYRFRPIATEDILGNTEAFNEGNVENYGKQTLWDIYNPANRIRDKEPLTSRQQARGTLTLDWQVVKGLNYHTDLYMNKSWRDKKVWTGAIANDNFLDVKTGEKLYAGSVDYEKRDSWGLRWSNTLSYDFSLVQNHRLNILAGHEMTDSGGTNMRIVATHFPSNFTKENAFSMINQYDQEKGNYSFSSGSSTPGRIVSYFGRLNYSMLDRYLFTATFRADGSSTFAPGNRWGYFPAAALAWRVSEEAFMKDFNWLDNFKVRFSYGQVGNDGINSDLWSQEWTSETDRRMQYTTDNEYNQSYTYSSKEMANRDLKWETTVTRNLGIDFALFNNRIWGTVDLYKNTTKDLLMKTSLPGITGFTATYANIGQTSNKGIELSLSGELFRNKDWNITASANINFNKNNVDKLADNVTGLYTTRWASSSTFPTNDYILEVGKPVGQIRGLVYDGFYTVDDFNYVDGVYILKEGIPDVGSFIGSVHGVSAGERAEGQIAYPGVVKYKDLDESGYIDENDVVTIGNTNPKHTGGFSLNVVYKNFDLGAHFNWSYGNDVYNLNKLSTLYGYKESGVYENKMGILRDAYKIYDVVNGQLVRYSAPDDLNRINRDAKLPLAYNENGVTSSIGIEDGSFLRLNTLTLGYTVPKSITQKAAISNLRIYGSIYNVFTLTGYSGLDPEVNTNMDENKTGYPTTGLDWNTYPRARSFVIGLNLSF